MPNWVFLAGCLVMAVSFFLPWISYLFISFSGWDIASSPLKLSGIIKVPGKFYALLLLFLMPIGAMAGAIIDLMVMGKGRNIIWLKAVTAALPIISFLLVSLILGWGEDFGAPGGRQDNNSDGPGFFDIAGVGLYLMMASMLLCGIGAFINPKPKQRSA